MFCPVTNKAPFLCCLVQTPFYVFSMQVCSAIETGSDNCMLNSFFSFFLPAPWNSTGLCLLLYVYYLMHGNRHEYFSLRRKGLMVRETLTHEVNFSLFRPGYKLIFHKRQLSPFLFLLLCNRF